MWAFCRLLRRATPKINEPDEGPMSVILVIEDDASVGKLVEVVLGLGGHEVSVSRNVSSARRALAEVVYDLVILDLSLPDGSGYDLLRYLRQDLARSTPVLVLTGLRQRDVKERCDVLGVEGHMDKPFSPQELATRVESLTGP